MKHPPGEEARARLIEILEAVTRSGYISPGDVVVATGLPRYLVLAAFQCLEALGIIEQVYSRGSYKVYTATMHARKLLDALKAGEPAPVLALLGSEEHQEAPVAAEGGEA